MLTAEARIDTQRPGRYLVQFCKHAAAMGGTHGHRPRVHLRDLLARRDVRVHADWTDASGTVTFDPWGRCVLAATATNLVLRVEADHEDDLARIQDIVTRNVDRFGRRERLTVNWSRPETPAERSGTGPAA